MMVAWFLVACSSGGTAAPPTNGVDGGVEPGPPPGPGPDLPADGGAVDGGAPDDAGGGEPFFLRHDGGFARKILPAGTGYVVLYDKPVALREAFGLPSRVLGRVSASGEDRPLYAPAAGRQLIDVAAHGSAELTVLEAADDGWFLIRLDAEGKKRGETRLSDPAILTDPPALTPAESTSPIEERVHDVGRIMADGEQVFGALRTGRHSVIAYRWHWDGTAYAASWRTLVVPAHSIPATAIFGGTYDTFGQLEAHYGVFVGIDADHIGYVGVSHARLESGAMVKAHQKVFGEVLVTDPDRLDAFVSRVDAEGVRLGTSVVGTDDDEQLYELRAGRHGVYALGRSEHWNAQGTGFDAMVAHVSPHGKVTMRRFDVDAGDIAFDALEETDGSLLVVGASGYSQNPSGASINEASQAFARRLRKDGTTEVIALPLPSSAPRHNEARFLVRHDDGTLVVAGMTDGPGTHSADGDATLLRATGWVAQLRDERRIVPPR